MDEQKISRKAVLPAFLGMIALAVVICVAMNLIQPHLANNMFNWFDLVGGAAEGSVFYRVMWFLIDLDQGTFMASIIGTGFLLIGLAVASHLERKKSPHMGTGVCGMNGIIFKMVACAFAGLILGQIVNDICGLIVGVNPFATYGWVPTFAIFLAAQVLVAFYGTTPSKMVTITVLSSIVTYLSCWFFLHFVVVPVGLPLFCCVSFGLIVAVPVCSEILRVLPWIKKADPAPAPDEYAEVPMPVLSENKWFVHTTFGDIGQLVVWGSSIAVIFMYIGSIINWAIDPLNVGYSVGNFGTMIAAQIATAALGIFIYYPRWKKNGFTFTFGGIVFSSAIIITYANHWVVVLSAIILGALVVGPFIDWLIKTFNKNGRYHVIFFVQIGIGVCVAVYSLILKYLLLPVLC